MIFKTILVPYDGSVMSDKALDKAVELATIIKESRIIIMHVVPEIPNPIFSRVIRSPKTGEVITFSEYMVSLYQEMESEMREKLKERKEKYQTSRERKKEIIRRIPKITKSPVTGIICNVLVNPCIVTPTLTHLVIPNSSSLYSIILSECFLRRFSIFCVRCEFRHY